MAARTLFSSLLAIGLAAGLAPAGAFAGEREDALIAKVVEAYGGERLQSLRSLRIVEELKSAFPGQGYAEDHVEFTTLRRDAQFDLAGERASLENWTYNWNAANHSRVASTEDGIVAINYLTGTYQPGAAPDYHAAFGNVIRLSDTLLAYYLHKLSASAAIVGERSYLGRPHAIVTFEMPQSPPLTLYVDSGTGMIAKMTRDSAFGTLSYEFRHHRSAGGIAYASDVEFFVGGAANIVSVSRAVTANSVRGSIFAVERGVVQEPARVDTSAMTVDRIAEGVHLAGTGAAYTAFIDAGDYVIGVDGVAGLAARYEAYKAAAGHDKPLRYQIVTHHHTDHLAGMGDAFALGAVLVTPAGAVANLRTAVGAEIPEDRLMVVGGTTNVGPVSVHLISTSHIGAYALAYIPAAKTIVQVDHYSGLFEDSNGPAGIGSVTLKEAVDALGLDVDLLISGHNRKVVPWAEFEAVVAAFDDDPCPSKRPICR